MLNMTYLKEFKEKIEQRLANGEKAAEISRETGVSVSTIYKWRRESKEKEQQPEVVKSKKEEANDFKESMKVEVSPEPVVATMVENKGKEIDYFHGIIKYLEDKKRSIYVSMQSSNYKVQTKGIAQWDKMEALMEKVNENRDNKDYLDQLHEKILHLQELEKGMDR